MQRWRVNWKKLSEKYLRKNKACGYHVPPFVETGCFPWTFARPEMNLSAMSMFLSFDIDSVKIFLFSGSIATQSQTYSKPTLSNISSTMYSDIFLLFDDIFLGWYFCIQFHSVPKLIPRLFLTCRLVLPLTIFRYLQKNVLHAWQYCQ